MLKSPSLSKLLLCFVFWLSTGLSMRVNGQDGDDGFFDDSSRGDSFGGERFGGFRGRGGFRGGFRGGDFEGGEGRSWGGSGEGRFGRDWGGEDGGGRWGGGGGRWGNRGGFGPGGGDDGMHASEGQNGLGGNPQKLRLTVDLPSSFAEGDRDGDGQIGLYEWRQWRRGDMAGFLALDHNGDGFLTPAELVKGPRQENSIRGVQNVALVSTGETNGSPSGTTGIMAGSMKTSSGSGGAAATGDSPEANRATSMFRLLDSNHNGQLDPEEWGKAKTIRSQFESAKIDMSGAMTRDDFVKHFVALNKKS